jgi:hypothetical protein
MSLTGEVTIEGPESVRSLALLGRAVGSSLGGRSRPLIVLATRKFEDRRQPQAQPNLRKLPDNGSRRNLLGAQLKDTVDCSCSVARCPSTSLPSGTRSRRTANTNEMKMKTATTGFNKIEALNNYYYCCSHFVYLPSGFVCNLPLPRAKRWEPYLPKTSPRSRRNHFSLTYPFL